MPATKRTHRDAGQATLEYVGSLFVVVLLIGSVLLGATPVGQAIAAKICEAFGATCGTSAAENRQDALGIKCTVSSRDNSSGINGAVEVKVTHSTKGAQTNYGDGTSRVVLSEKGEAGFELGSTALGPIGELKADATGGSELAYIYSFPQEMDGTKGATDFFDDRRGVTNQVVGAVVPGAQSIDEATGRVTDAVGNFFQDTFGGRSDAEKAKDQLEQQAKQADAVQAQLSIQGNADANLGAGVKKKTGGDDSPAEELKAPASANANANANLKGTVTVPLHSGGPDAVGASFTGEVGAAGSAGTTIGGDGLPPFFNVGGQAAAKASYTVSYDKNGVPTKLAITTETSYGSTTGGKPRTWEGPGGEKAGGKLTFKGNEVTVTTRTLDLDTSTPEGAANKAAFDEAFDSPGFTFNEIPVKASIPKTMVKGTIGELNPATRTDYGQLMDRLSSDAFVQTSTYDETGSDWGGDLKFAGVGGGVSGSSTDRQLMGSTAHDNRTGADVQLADCG